MTTTEDLMKRLGEIADASKTYHKKVDENKLGQTELKEALEKMGIDLKSVTDDLKAIKETPVHNYKNVDAKSVSHKMAAMGIADLKDITNVREYADERVEKTGRKLFDEEVKSTLQMLDDCYLAHTLMGFCSDQNKAYERRCVTDGPRAAFKAAFPVLGGRLDDFTNEFATVMGKAAGDYLDTGEATYGAEWVPDGWSSNMLEDMLIATPFLGMFRRFSQPTQTFNHPVLGGRGQAYLRNEVANAIKNVMQTAKRTWTAKTIAVYQAFSSEMDQDSIVAVLPEVRAVMARDMGEGLEAAIVTGDTAAVHMDDDIETDANTASRTERAFDGLRDYALNVLTSGDYDGAAGDLTAAIVLGALKLMGKYAAKRPGECVLAVSTQSYLQLIGDSVVRTVDQYGASATILTGEVARVYGVPVILSNAVEDLSDNVAATGVNTLAGPNTLSTAILLNRVAGHWMIGDRQAVRFEQDRNIVNGVDDVVATARYSFNCGISGAALPHTVVIRNIT